MKEKKSVENWLYSTDKGRIVNLVLTMGEMAEKALKDAFNSLVHKDSELARAVVNGDDELDAMEREIDHECLRSIAMRQPVREELRFIFAVLKTITDVERIGDEAVNIAEWTLELEKYPEAAASPAVSRMQEIAEGMLRDALKAFSSSDAKLARDICRRDDLLDGIYADVFNEFIELTASGAKDAGIVRPGVGQMWVARHLERVGDHSTNIAERVYFMTTGETLLANAKQ